MASMRMTDGLGFKPAGFVVHAGDTVEWTNTSTIRRLRQLLRIGRAPRRARKVVLPAGAAPFGSGEIAAGRLGPRPTFTVPGTYKSICVPHA